VTKRGIQGGLVILTGGHGYKHFFLKLRPKKSPPTRHTIHIQDAITQRLPNSWATLLPLSAFSSRRIVLVLPLQHPLSNLPPMLRILPGNLRLALLSLRNPLFLRLRGPLRRTRKQYGRRALLRSVFGLRLGLPNAERLRDQLSVSS